MKPNLFFILLTSLYLMFLASCNQEDLFIETLEIVEEDTDDPIDEDSDNDSQIDLSTPCDFSLDNLESNSTVIINCLLDLGGETINLPSNVIISYEGGDIINGILNFGDNGIISGELLNSTLTIGGSLPQLKDPTFNFLPKRWDLVEGEVSQEVANKNREIMHDIILQIKAFGANTFKMDAIDAYFYSGEYGPSVFNLPSNFNLEMTDNTHLRSFLNSGHISFLQIYGKENIKVYGGHLYGYRHLPGNTNEEGGSFDYLIKIKTGQNIVIENVGMYYGADDGLAIESIRHAYEADYVPSKDILIKGCIFDSSGRNNLSIVDGQDIIVENCTFLNAGVNTPYSSGRAPRFAIDIEPVEYAATNPLQKVDRVIIRNNIEKGSAVGGFVAADGDDILFEGNSFENFIAITGASNVSIINNPSLSEIHAGALDAYSKSRNKNTIISGNTIKNSNLGIIAVNQDIKIFDNKFENCGSAFYLNSLSDSHIYNNTIVATNGSSTTLNYDAFNGLNYLNNVIIENNSIDIVGKAFNFTGVNWDDEEKDYTFTIKNNTIKSNRVSHIQWSTGGIFLNNTLEGSGINLDGAMRYIIDNNQIINGSIQFGQNETNNLVITNNYIEAWQDAILSDAITNEEIKNIVISGNVLKSMAADRHWGGVNINGYNGITVNHNTGVHGQHGRFIKYRGDHSTFTTNRTEENIVSNDIVGTNNTIIE